MSGNKIAFVRNEENYSDFDFDSLFLSIVGKG
jgi:hypothetical protein